MGYFKLCIQHICMMLGIILLIVGSTGVAIPTSISFFGAASVLILIAIYLKLPQRSFS